MVCGGGSSIPGLAARLLREMRGLTPQSIAPGIYGVPVRGPIAPVRRAPCACRIYPCTGVSFLACLLPDCMPEFRTTQAHAAVPGNATYTATPAASSVACCILSHLAQDYMPEATLRHAAWMGGAVLARVSFSQVRACCV